MLKGPFDKGINGNSHAGVLRYQRTLPHLQVEGRTFFVTFRVTRGRLLSEQMRSIVLEHCLKGHRTRFYLHGIVVMPDHVHMVMTPMPDENDNFPALYKLLKIDKGASSRAVNKLQCRSDALWQDESFDHLLRSWESAESKVNYIADNPVRRRLAKAPEQYQWLWLAYQHA